MRTRSSLPLLFILPWLLLACIDDSTLSVTTSRDHPIDVKLREGESVLLHPDEVLVEFTRTEEESRCPEDVVCVWAGRAIIQLRLNPDRPSPSEFALTIPGTVKSPYDGTPFDTLGYRWTLRQLNPYPRSSTPSGPIPYEPLLRIQKLE